MRRDGSNAAAMGVFVQLVRYFIEDEGRANERSEVLERWTRQQLESADAYDVLHHAAIVTGLTIRATRRDACDPVSAFECFGPLITERLIERTVKRGVEPEGLVVQLQR
ncbi:MAG: hypothetical protein JWR85_3823 [Marmoricola sp.]|nr:hypothetical protein [Marmoricola sp.]